MNRHLISATLLWIALTVVGETLLFASLFPVVGSEEAEEFDLIFEILLIMGIPVFAFVVAVVAYAMMQFRVVGVPARDGPANRGNRWIPRIWLGITGTLAGITIVIGLVGLSNLQDQASAAGWGAEGPSLVIKVNAQQFAFDATYPDGTYIPPIPDNEIVVPVNTDVKFEINAVDVIHSFWIPAFRMKIDAIPGRTTFFTAHPTELGSYEEDDAFRVQCAELCGLNHTVMRSRLRVVTQEEFDAWLASQDKEAN
jgi:cytochrome c oxidase subunit 2